MKINNVDISKRLDEMSKNEQAALLSQWTKQIYLWINKARIYIKEIKLEQEYLQATNRDISKSLITLNNYLKRSQSRAKISGKKIMIDGYELLNNIGEQIRGEKILYTLIVTSDGKKIGSSDIQKTYTAKIPFSEFLNTITTSGRQRLVLKDSSTIVKMIESTKSPLKGDIEEWDYNKIKEYQLFNNQVRGMAHKHWEKISEGNMTEIYLRYLNDGQFIKALGSHEYFSLLGTYVKMTLSSPAIFYQGGDIGNEQLKAINATITNLTTLIVHAERLLQILIRSEQGYKVIEKYLFTSKKIDVEKEIDNNIENIINELIKMFTDKINRQLT